MSLRRTLRLLAGFVVLTTVLPLAGATSPTPAHADSMCPPGYTGPGSYLWTISTVPLIRESGNLPATCVGTFQPYTWLPAPPDVRLGDEFTITAPPDEYYTWDVTSLRNAGITVVSGCGGHDQSCSLRADGLRAASVPGTFTVSVDGNSPNQPMHRSVMDLAVRLNDLWTTAVVLRNVPPAWNSEFKLRAVKPGDPTAAQDCRPMPNFSTDANGTAGAKRKAYIANARCWLFLSQGSAGVEPNVVTYGYGVLPLGNWQIEAVSVADLKGPAAGGLTPQLMSISGNLSDNIDVDLNPQQTPTLSVSVIADTLGDDKPSVGSVVTTHVTVAANTDGVVPVKGITFDGGVLLSGAPAGNVDLSAMPAPPPAFDLAPGAKVTFDVPVKITETGKVTLTSSVTGTASDGKAVHATDDTTISTAAIAVAVVLDPTSLELLTNDDGPIPQSVTATVTVRNTSDHEVTGVSLQRFEPDWRDPDDADFVLPFRQTSTPIVTALEPLSIGDLDVGESKDVSATFEVSEAGDFVIEVQALSSDGVALGDADLDVTSDVILRVDAQFAGFTPPATPGQTILVTGTFTNQSRTDTLILEPYRASVVGHGAGGFAVALDQPLTTAATSATGDECACSKPIEIAPHETFHFQMLVSVGPAAIVGPNHVDFQFVKPKGIRRDEEGVDSPIDAGRVRVSERAKNLEAVVSQAAPPDPDEASFIAKYGAFTVGFEESMGRAAIGLKDLLVAMPSLASQALYKTADGEYARSVIDDTVKYVSYLNQAWETMPDADRADLFAWAQVYGDAWLLTKPGQAGANASQAITGFATNLGNLSATDELAFANQLGTIAGQMGFDTVSGAMIEMAFCKIAKAIPRYGANIQAAEVADEATQATRVAERQLADGKGLAALKPAEPLTLEAIRRFVGVNPYEMQRILDVAAKDSVVIGFRSRSARAVELLEQGKAVLKNEVWKIKTVNRTDIDYLGYREFDEAKAVLRSPISPERVEELIAAKGLSEGEALLVRERYETRVKEWLDPDGPKSKNKGLRTEYLRRAEDGWVNVPFDPNLNRPLGSQVPVVDRPARTALEKVTSPKEGGEYWVIKQSNPDIPGSALLDIVGDIDIITITDEVGRVLSGERQLDVYKDLIAAIGIQHGETFTLTLEKVREGLLGDHTIGHEPLLVVHPSGMVRAAYFEPGFSLTGLADHTDFQYLVGQEINLAKRPGTAGLMEFPEYVEQTTHSFLSPATWKEFGSGVKDILVDRAGKIYRMATPTSVDQWDVTARTWIINVPIQVDGLLRLAPQTSTGFAPAGAQELPIAERSDLGFAESTPWFEVGDQVVIDPGGPNEQFATITGFGSLILDQPLAHDIIPGTMVSLIPRPDAVVPTPDVPTDPPAAPPDPEAPAPPVVDAPVPDAPVAEAPVAEAPVAEAPVADAPVADASADPMGMPVAASDMVDAPLSPNFDGALPATGTNIVLLLQAATLLLAAGVSLILVRRTSLWHGAHPGRPDHPR